MNTTKEADAIVRLFCHSTQTRNFLWRLFAIISVYILYHFCMH
jgi:hypothetical protein